MTLEKVAKILTDYKGEKIEVTEDTTFAELGLDSLDTVELLMSFEDEFGVEIEMNEDIKTIGNIVELIDSQIE